MRPAALGRGDLAEVDRLNDSTAYRSIRVQEPACFERLQRLTWLTLYFTVRVRDLQLTVLAVFSAMMIRLESDGRREESESLGDAKFAELVELIEQKISRLKALHAACVEFCSGLGVRPPAMWTP